MKKLRAQVIKYAKKLKPSKRGELEIIDLLNQYKAKKNLSAESIGRGGAWLDTGSISDYYKTIAFVQAVENRQGLKIGCPEEVAWRNGWISNSQLENVAKQLMKNSYGKYLLQLLE